jgi:hypothetical protein
MIIKNKKDDYHAIDYKKDKFRVFQAQDVENLLKWNYADKRAGSKYYLDPKTKELMHVARIPQITYAQWVKQYPELSGDSETASKFLLELLDREENVPFKTITGRTS